MTVVQDETIDEIDEALANISHTLKSHSGYRQQLMELADELLDARLSKV